jgi:hypothetical protein
MIATTQFEIICLPVCCLKPQRIRTQDYSLICCFMTVWIWNVVLHLNRRTPIEVFENRVIRNLFQITRLKVREDGSLLGYCTVMNSPPWWWTQYTPTKRPSTRARLHAAISQKTLIFILEVLRTSHLTKWENAGESCIIRATSPSYVAGDVEGMRYMDLLPHVGK